MRRSIGFLAAFSLSLPALANGGHSGGSHSSGSHTSSHAGGGTHAVRGHMTDQGMYVKPHRQTNPDGTQRNNWSTKGNVNPYTVQAGTKKATQ
jgi:hypothetical protein